MQFISTAGESPVVSFEAALLQGLAPDGGLYVPEDIPDVAAAQWRSSDSFPEMAAEILTPWLGRELSPSLLASISARALDFPVPLVALDGPGRKDVYVLELFHGPTLSFKDFGARMMARWMNHFMQKRDERLTILVATSGDTGSAVADGFAGQDAISVVLLYPEGQVSPVQEQQLTVRRPGVHTLAVEGSFDDCQRLVKAAFRDEALSDRLLSSANSINIGRLLPQMLYYFWAFQQGGWDEAVVCVPSGNLGNLTAGVMAAQSGLPVRRFLAAHNANDFFPRFLAGETRAFGDSIRTYSNAMDVGAPSNFERLRSLLPGEALSEQVWASSIADDETLASMRRVFDETGYAADPHTAVGLETATRYRRATGDNAPLIVLSTAHPAKFPETVKKALSQAPEMPARLDAQLQSTEHARRLPPTAEAFRDWLMQELT